MHQELLFQVLINVGKNRTTQDLDHRGIETRKETVEHVLGQQMLHYQFPTLNSSSWLKQHKVVKEQLYFAATIWRAQRLKELLLRSALDIALEAKDCPEQQEFGPKF